MEAMSHEPWKYAGAQGRAWVLRLLARVEEEPEYPTCHFVRCMHPLFPASWRTVLYARRAKRRQSCCGTKRRRRPCRSSTGTIDAQSCRGAGSSDAYSFSRSLTARKDAAQEQQVSSHLISLSRHRVPAERLGCSGPNQTRTAATWACASAQEKGEGT